MIGSSTEKSAWGDVIINGARTGSARRAWDGGKVALIPEVLPSRERERAGGTAEGAADRASR